MRELASFLLAYTGVAAAFAAGSRPAHRARPILLRVRPILVVLAVAAVAGSAALWPRSDGAVLAGVCVVMIVSLMATLFVLLAPVAPRVIWWIAALSPVLAMVLVVLA